MRGSFLAVVLLLAACADTPADRALPEQELEAVRGVIRSYAQAWMAMDSAAILSLFTDDAVISPSGLSPREGKQAIRAFWFPNDSSTTDVLEYSIEVLDAGGSGSMAYTYERGDLSYRMTIGKDTLSRSSRAFATTIYTRTPDGDWRIRRRMWTDLRVSH